MRDGNSSTLDLSSLDRLTARFDPPDHFTTDNRIDRTGLHFQMVKEPTGWMFELPVVEVEELQA